ncbi:MAG TPA: alpha-amylase family glycosyl hydrolase [Silvibacterium sp.]|nr:alpha-amylase family glycosyl hydrolase [Silvibacterium sp.]
MSNKKTLAAFAAFVGCFFLPISARRSSSAQMLSAGSPTGDSTRAPRTLPWFDSAAAIRRVTLKPNTQFWKFEHLSLDPKTSEEQLRHWKEQGIDAMEIFAPAESGNSYDGLDAINRFQLDPSVGTIDDFRQLVQRIHSLGMSVITFDNLGYSSTYDPQFLKGCSDVRAARDTRESRLFLWSDTTHAPPPVRGNSYFLLRPNQPNYDAARNEFWQWDDRCQHAYWTKWPGKDAHGNPTHLPQYNWAGNDWPDEADKVVRFWMDTGLDGMIIDAVNWYVGYSWDKGNRHITDVIQSYGGSKFSQPEGAGAFHGDDSAGWITDGHWTNLQDYGLGVWWEKNNDPLRASVIKSDPGLLEAALRSYHDRVVAVGGSLYVTVPVMHDEQQQQFVEALLAASGDLLCYCGRADEKQEPASGIPALLKAKSQHPALYQNSLRRRVPTNDDGKFYAFVRTSADGSERLLAVFNFQPQPAVIEVDAAAVNAAGFSALGTGEVAVIMDSKLRLELPARGYRLFVVHPPLSQ